MSFIGKLNKKLSKIADAQETKKNREESISDIVEKITVETLHKLSGKSDISVEQTPDNIIGFMGISGGVGATTTLVNVATALRTTGKSVLVVDANIMFPMVANYIPFVKDELTTGDLVSYLAGEHTLGQCISYNNGQVSVMSALNRDIQNFLAVDNGEMNKTIELFLADVRTLFDIVLIDIPTQGVTSDIVNAILFRLDQLYLVLDENISCLSGIEKFKSNLAKCGIEKDDLLKRVIFNKRTNIHYPKSCFEKMGVNIISVIPFEIGVVESGLQGTVYLKGGLAKGPFAKAYCKQIENLANHIVKECTYVPNVETESVEDTEVENNISYENGHIDALIE